MKPRGNVKMDQKKRSRTVKKSIDLGTMSTDDFMMNGFETDESEEEINRNETRNDKSISVKKHRNGMKHESFSDDDDDDDDNDDVSGDGDEDNDAEVEVSGDDSEIEEAENDSEENDQDGGTYLNHSNSATKNEEKSKDEENDWTSANFSHKKAIAKLKKTDPEFYKYLEENDKDLLNFDESDSEAEENGEAGGKFHKPPDNLEVGSDESDYEDVGVKKGSRTITLKMIQKWEIELQKTTIKSCESIIEVMHAFHAAVVRVSNDDNDVSAKYVVTGSAVFNAVIQLCVLELQPALKKYLRLSGGKHIDPTKNQIQWGRVQSGLKSYLNNLVKLLGGVSSADILAVMLKHLHQMTPFLPSFHMLFKPLLKMLVTLWSTGEDTVRVVAFLCLLRLTTYKQNKLDVVLKKMYLAFIRNCKFVSPNTKPAINFMRRSLVEMFALDLKVSYQHAFLYIRQLAIHLRNAITLHTQETIQTVYNWQFINSIHLWADLLGVTVHKPQLQDLLYPHVQVIIGTINLKPIAQYFPLRFHCTQILIDLSKRTCTFIPVLPSLLEVWNIYNFNKPHKKVSMKPKTFSFIIRTSKTEMLENGFKDVVIDTIYQQMLEYLSNESNSISFPDLIIPASMQIKAFLKTCRVSNYCRKMKQLLDKIIENSQMVEKERQKVNFKLSDQKSIAAWETQLKLKGTPLSKYFENWSKIHAQQQAKKLTQNDKIGDFNLPVLKKRNREDRPKSDEPVVLFPSDDSDSDIDILKPGEKDNEPMKKRGKRGSSKRIKNTPKAVRIDSIKERNVENDVDEGDIIEDMKLEDFI